MEKMEKWCVKDAKKALAQLARGLDEAGTLGYYQNEVYLIEEFLEQVKAGEQQ